MGKSSIRLLNLKRLSQWTILYLRMPPRVNSSHMLREILRHYIIIGFHIGLDGRQNRARQVLVMLCFFARHTHMSCAVKTATDGGPCCFSNHARPFRMYERHVVFVFFAHYICMLLRCHGLPQESWLRYSAKTFASFWFPNGPKDKMGGAICGTRRRFVGFLYTWHG